MSYPTAVDICLVTNEMEKMEDVIISWRLPPEVAPALYIPRPQITDSLFPA